MQMFAAIRPSRETGGHPLARSPPLASSDQPFVTSCAAAPWCTGSRRTRRRVRARSVPGSLWPPPCLRRLHRPPL